MKQLKIHPAKVDPENPFSIDLLDREQEIKNLTPLILNLNSPAVFAVNSRWGTGKTTFVDMWSAQLINEGYNTLKFNAWDTDFSSDPLIAFLGEMNDQLGEFIGEEGEKRERWDKTKKLGKKIVKLSLPALLKILTAGVINADEFVKTGAAELFGTIAEDALESYTNQKNAIDEFKNSLYETFKDENNRSIVIFVDELDRCRPDYAINLLERIKHLFDINGLIFILALDREQLSHSVRSVYGEGMDAEGYLRRFIDFEYSLATPDIRKHIKTICKSLKILEFFTQDDPPNGHFLNDALENTLILFVKEYNLSLRETEQLIARINLGIRASHNQKCIYPELLAFLTIVRDKDKSLYENFVCKGYKETEIVKHIHKAIPLKNRTDYCAQIEAYLIFAKHPKSFESSDIYKEHKSIIDSNTPDTEEYEYSSSVIRITHYIKLHRYNLNLKAIKDRIEMLSNFSVL